MLPPYMGPPLGFPNSLAWAFKIYTAVLSWCTEAGATIATEARSLQPYPSLYFDVWQRFGREPMPGLDNSTP